MKSVSNFKKLLIVSVTGFITVICWHAYFLMSIDTETRNEAASDEIVEKINLLLLNISGYKNYQGTLQEQWNFQVGAINEILETHPNLKAAVKRDFSDFTTAIEPGVMVNNSQIARIKLLDTHDEYTDELLTKLKLFSRNTSEELMGLRWISSIFLIFLFFISQTLLLFYFYSFHSGYKGSRILLQNALKKMKTNEDIISFRKETEDKVEGELREQLNELITGLHYKLGEKDKELQDKAELLSLVVEHLPIGLAISSLNGQEIKIANKKFWEFYSLEPDHDGESDFTESSLHLPKIPVDYKNQVVVDKEETNKSIDLKRIPVPNQDLLLSIIKNNTELVEKEEALEESKRFSEIIFQTASVGLALLDNEGCFQKVNRTYCKIYGYSEEELIGQDFSILLPPEDKAYYTRTFRKKVAARTVVDSNLKETRVIQKNGEIRNVLSNSQLFISRDFKGFIYSVIDITETTTEKDKMLAAIEGGGLGTWNINLETGGNEVNEEWAKMLGYKKFEIPHNKEFFESLVHPEDLPSFQRSIDAILQGKQSSFYKELRLKCKNGEFKWVLDSGKVIKRNSKGRVLVMAGSHVDIDKVKKKELELLSTGDRLSRAQEMGMVGDWELDLASETFLCSTMVFRIFGRKKSSAIAFKEVIGQFHHSSASKLQWAINKLVDDKSSISMEGDIFLPDGKLKHLRIIAVPVLGNNHEVLRVMGIFQDVTSIKIAQAKLETTNKRLQLLSDNIPGGLIQFRLNGNLPPQVLYLSKGAEKIWNLSREEVFRGNGELLFKNIHPKDHNFIKRSLQVATKRFERLSIIWRTLSETGEITWHHFIGIPTRNKDGTITWNALVLDVTEKKIAENKLREQEEFMQVLTRYASDGIIACDLDGKVKFVNQTLKNWAGIQNQNVEPENWPKAYHLYSVEDDRHLKISDLSLFRTLETGKACKQEFLIKRPGKPVRYVQSNGSILKDTSGNRIGAMVVLRDISQRVQQEIEVSNASLKAREKERTKIASDIHDGITQSLSVVAMNMKNLRYDYTDVVQSENYTKALECLNNVIDQSRSLAHTIMPNSIKDFGLIEAVRELVEQSSSASEKEISFEYTEYRRIAPNKELHIFRVIQEGLGNALKHSGGTKIQIRLFFEENYVRCTIQDNGKGFDVKKSYHKQGIGLISMKERVKKMDGKFRIFSEKGTLISFNVPVKYKAESNEETSSHFYSR